MEKAMQNSISFSLLQRDEPAGRSALPIRVLSLALCSLGLAVLGHEVLPGTVGSAPVVAAVLFVLSLGIFALLQTKISRFVLPGGAVLLLVFAALLFSPLRDGMCVLANDVLSALPAKTGKIVLLLETENAAHGILAALFAGTFLSLLLTCGRVPSSIVAALFVAGAAGGVLPFGAGMVLLFLGITLRMLGGEDYERGTQALLAVLLCGALAVGAVLLFTGVLSGVPDAAKEKLHEIRYDSTSNSMPEGNLRNLSAWNRNDTPALSVTMETPQKLYLRGMTGERYTGTEWTALNTADEAAWADRFYWLHKDGFYSLDSIGSAEALTSGTSAQNMTIENLSACREHAYLPYALASYSGLDSARIGDAEAPGTETETLTYIPGSVPQWFETQAQLAVRQGDSTISAYLANEEIYREYARENYTAISDTTAAAVERALNLADTDEERTLSQIKDIILDTLETAITYDESAVSCHTQGDFVTYVLERSARGYSVHYATCATLMLRYFGVPARYVEGYFLSADDAAHYKSGETITLTEANAHAWAEYYLDGVGWIPFETTPGYIDDEELAVGAAQSAAAHFYRKTEPQVTENTPDSVISDDEGVTRHFRASAAAIAAIIAGLILLFILIWIVRERRHLRAALQKIDSADNRTAIAGLYGYADALRRHAPKAENVPGEDAAAELNREALFSSHAMTDTQRESMRGYTAAVLSACRASWSIPRRIFYRCFNSLY